MSLSPHGKHDNTLSFRTAIKEGDDSLKQYITKCYSGMGWKTNDILNGMMASDDVYASEIVQVKPPSLSRGRFVMVGDAGYAPGFTGGGTSLALAGAYTLAGEVFKNKGNLAAGLEGYEQVMRPIINDLSKVPPLVTTIMAPQTAWGIWLRNHIFALIAWSRILEFGQKFFAGAFAQTNKEALPNYEWVV